MRVKLIYLRDFLVFLSASQVFRLEVLGQFSIRRSDLDNSGRFWQRPDVKFVNAPIKPQVTPPSIW
jgi:hypothetical protein